MYCAYEMSQGCETVDGFTQVIEEHLYILGMKSAAIVPSFPEKKNAYKSSSTQSILIIFVLFYWSEGGHSLLKRIEFPRNHSISVKYLVSNATGRKETNIF